MPINSGRQHSPELGEVQHRYNVDQIVKPTKLIFHHHAQPQVLSRTNHDDDDEPGDDDTDEYFNNDEEKEYYEEENRPTTKRKKGGHTIDDDDDDGKGKKNSKKSSKKKKSSSNKKSKKKTPSPTPNPYPTINPTSNPTETPTINPTSTPTKSPYPTITAYPTRAPNGKGFQPTSKPHDSSDDKPTRAPNSTPAPNGKGVGPTRPPRQTPQPTLEPTTLVTTLAPGITIAPSISDNVQKVDLTPYGIAYTVTQSGLPSSTDYAQVSALTISYLEDYFTAVFQDSLLASLQRVETLFQGGNFVFDQPIQADYATAAYFYNPPESVIVPSVSDLDLLLEQAFLGEHGELYISELQTLSSPIFSSTTAVAVTESSSTKNQLKHETLPVAASSRAQSSKDSSSSSSSSLGWMIGAGIGVMGLGLLAWWRIRRNKSKQTKQQPISIYDSVTVFLQDDDADSTSAGSIFLTESSSVQ
eukprot:CAMPEP_0194206478 /NCGR_PEP_ID=MMETSP0156-20130528/5499_1 /TAXON_ID=33649 /ORGANISM="Thalassionema nitzschioides, Strain L26-B" /LENGTH=470 /DNA_ID=CAMNT_0038933011 /DNA_START=17 /DNA_END=1429 /DNA_ORIENTATION=-